MCEGDWLALLKPGERIAPTVRGGVQNVSDLDMYICVVCGLVSFCYVGMIEMESSDPREPM